MYKKILLVLMAGLFLMMTACGEKQNNPDSESNTDMVREMSELVTKDDSVYYNSDSDYASLVEAMDCACNMNDTLNYLNDIKGTFVLANDEKIIYAAFLNSYENDGSTPVSINTTYEIGSVTKQITAVAVLKLVEQGKLSLDDTIDKYFPEYAYGDKITIENLIKMESGIPDYINNMDEFFKGITKERMQTIYDDSFSDEAFLKELSKNELLFEPGKDFMYSNTNYHILALIIEKVTGKTYYDYVRENVFVPCGMSNSSCQAVGDVTSRSESERPMPYYTMQNFSRGCMDIHSSAADMLNFERALYNKELLNDEFMTYIFDTEVGEYNCGWVRVDDNAYYHTGSTIAYGTVVSTFTTERWGNLYLLQFYPTKECYSYSNKMMDEIMKCIRK